MKTLFKNLYVVFLFVLLTSCEKKENIATANVGLNFANLMNNSPLLLENTTYTTALGGRFAVSELKYYISNIKLINSQTGKVFTEPDSYHLIERKSDTHIDEVVIKNVALGKYDQIEFAVGIDKTRNLSTDQVGDLDPSNNMAWDWKTGYKFLLLEGNVFLSTGERRGLVYHVGADENYRTIRLNFPSMENLKVEEGKTPTINISVEIAKLFNSPNRIDIEQHRTVMFGEVAGKVADNYATMFSIEKIGL
ncbi:MAG: hypothetical protein OHK0057_36810 [Thermoflexibacter sp.]